MTAPIPDPKSLSRYLRRQFLAHPDWEALTLNLALAPMTGAVLYRELAALKGDRWQDEAHLKRVLRQLRNRWLCAVIERDLSGRGALDEVMAAMSALADLSISEALAFIDAETSARHGVPMGSQSQQAQCLLVVAMGKLGAFELNVSSDVDLIFLYPEDGDTQASEQQRGISNAEYFNRVAKRLINVLSEVTADGFVFRVDMRLRPNGDAGPLACSFAMLEEYLIVQGRTWERLAWIKARLVSDSPHTQTLKNLLAPFVYRKYLDFSAIAALRDLHGEIRAEAARRSARYAHRAADVKLGRGGIREIEFIVQHFQLIRGGRDKELRARPTLHVMELLVARGLLRGSVARQLARTYQFLRNIEHRVQYRDDAQTHLVPKDKEELDALVQMCASWPDAPVDASALLARLAREQTFVEHQFDALFNTGKPSFDAIAAAQTARWRTAMFEDDSRKETELALQDAGFKDPEGAYNQVKGLWQSSRIRALPATARDRLEKLVPTAIDLAVRHAQEGCDATALLARLLALIEAVARRASYLALLYEFPDAFRRVADLLAASPWAARFLTQHPLLLDELLVDRSDEDDAVSIDAAQLLNEKLRAATGDVERQMDILRETFHAASFALLVDDLAGRLNVEVLADRLSALCDMIIAAALTFAWESLAPGALEPDFAVIAYGKLGGKELGYASDLDLVFITGIAPDSEKAVRYGRLAQRLISWLTTTTSAGALFEIDVRLRPDGAAGLNVATLEGFIHYQEKEAWVWEHQALTRARFAAGDKAVGAAFEETRRDILRRPRELDVLRGEIVAMRERMHEGHPNHSQEFDLKHDAGGMVDIEFMVQFLVLGHAQHVPGLLDNVGNIALLGRAARAGLIPSDLAQRCADAYRDYRFAQHRLRMAEARYARVAADSFVSQREAVETLYRQLFS